MTGTIDLAELARLCAGLPLRPLLDAIDERAPAAAPIELWLWDYQRRTLNEFRSGRSLAIGDLVESWAVPERSRWLRVQGDELGVLAVADGVDGGANSLDDVSLDGLADVLAVTVRANLGVGDDVAEVRRGSTELSLPAEMQWSLLPPERFRCPGLDVAAAVEPAYDTGGDVFDYALRDDRVFLAVLDARGHGLRAAMLSTVAAGAMRRARRHGADLATIGAEVAASIGALGDEREFVSAVMVEFDTVTGDGQWLSAGHLPPLVVGTDIDTLDLRPTLPLGMVVNGRSSVFDPQPFTLALGQRLVLYSDGIIENAAIDDGLSIGDDRFHRALSNRLIDDRTDDRHPARRVIEDLLALTGPELRDDATLMIVARSDRSASAEVEGS